MLVATTPVVPSRLEQEATQFLQSCVGTWHSQRRYYTLSSGATQDVICTIEVEWLDPHGRDLLHLAHRHGLHPEQNPREAFVSGVRISWESQYLPNSQNSSHPPASATTAPEATHSPDQATNPDPNPDPTPATDSQVATQNLAPADPASANPAPTNSAPTNSAPTNPASASPATQPIIQKPAGPQSARHAHRGTTGSSLFGVLGDRLYRDRGFATPDPITSRYSFPQAHTLLTETAYDGSSFSEECKLIGQNYRTRQTVIMRHGVTQVIGQYVETRLS